VAKAVASSGFFQQVWVKIVGSAAATVAAWLTGIVPKLWGWVCTAAAWGYEWAVHPITLPLWALAVVLLLAAVVPIELVLMAYRRRSGKGPPELRYTEYVRDFINGIVWRWDWLRGGDLGEPHPFCPACDTRLLESALAYRDQEEMISLQCRLCNRTVAGRLSKLDVRLEIDRRLRSGEWEHIVLEQRKAAEQRRMT